MLLTNLTEVYTLSLHDALPILPDLVLGQAHADAEPFGGPDDITVEVGTEEHDHLIGVLGEDPPGGLEAVDAGHALRSEEHTSELQSRQSRMPSSARKKKDALSR